MYQLVSMNLYVVLKNIQSSFYESIVDNLYVVDTKPIVRRLLDSVDVIGSSHLVKMTYKMAS